MAKFNLAQAAGYASMVSKLDTDKQEIRMISLDKIDVNHENFFDTSGFEDLKESIEVNGVLQPILLVEDGERFKILAGHRRYLACKYLAGVKSLDKFNEIPAVVMPPMSEAMEQLVLIQTNTTAREISYGDKLRAAGKLKTILVQLKAEGVKLPGKMRDIVAEQLEISKTEVARMNVIEKNLSDEWKEKLQANKINASMAYELARCSPEDQAEMLDRRCNNVATLEMWMEQKRCEDWLRSDCPYPMGCTESMEAERGEPVLCSQYNKILKHKAKGHPELCCGCCAECDHSDNCPDICWKVKEQKDSAARKAANEKELAEKREKWNKTRLPEFGDRLAQRMAELDITCEEIPALLTEAVSSLGCNNYSVTTYVPSWEGYADPTGPDQSPDFAIHLLGLCQVLNCTPNWLFGYEKKTGGWHKYPETCPDEDQLVLVRIDAPTMTDYMEYVYHLGEFFLPCDAEDKDWTMPITATFVNRNITHWTETPG